MKLNILQVDNRDDRTEAHHLIDRLPPALRIVWLRWCCQQCVMPNTKIHPVVNEPHSGLTMEVFFDWVGLLNTYSLDPAKSLAKLVEMARHHGTGKKFMTRTR